MLQKSIGNKYYPGCINQGQTNKNILIQMRTASKILNKPLRPVLPRTVLHHICSYIWASPLVLYYPIYQQNDATSIKIGDRLVFTSRSEDESLGLNHKMLYFTVEIKNIWKQVEKFNVQFEKVMHYARIFQDYLQLKGKQIIQQSQCTSAHGRYNNENDWKIVSENNIRYLGIFKTINKYKKDGIINEHVMMAFAELMSKNIILATVGRSQYIIIFRADSRFSEYSINCDKKICYYKFPMKQNFIKLGFHYSTHDENVELVVSNLNKYQLVNRIKCRNKLDLLDLQNCEEFCIDDVFVVK